MAMSENVLIVDDEKSILTALAGILSDEGFVCTLARSAKEALEVLNEEADDFFHAALLDIWMPGMDGLALLDWIKEHELPFPVIMMSGHGNIETAVKATKKGANDLFEKPRPLKKAFLR